MECFPLGNTDHGFLVCRPVCMRHDTASDNWGYLVPSLGVACYYRARLLASTPAATVCSSVRPSVSQPCLSHLLSCLLRIQCSHLYLFFFQFWNGEPVCISSPWTVSSGLQRGLFFKLKIDLVVKRLLLWWTWVQFPASTLGDSQLMGCDGLFWPSQVPEYVAYIHTDTTNTKII